MNNCWFTVQGMQLVTELERDLQIANIIVKVNTNSWTIYFFGRILFTVVFVVTCDHSRGLLFFCTIQSYRRICWMFFVFYAIPVVLLYFFPILQVSIYFWIPRIEFFFCFLCFTFWCCIWWFCRNVHSFSWDSVWQNGRRHLSRAMTEVSKDLVVAANVKKKQVLLVMF